MSVFRILEYVIVAISIWLAGVAYGARWSLKDIQPRINALQAQCNKAEAFCSESLDRCSALANPPGWR